MMVDIGIQDLRFGLFRTRQVHKLAHELMLTPELEPSTVSFSGYVVNAMAFEASGIGFESYSQYQLWNTGAPN